MGCGGSKEVPDFPLPDAFPKNGVKSVHKAFAARTEKHTVIGMGGNLMKSKLGSKGESSGLRFIDLGAGKALAYGVNNSTGKDTKWSGSRIGGPKLLLVDADEKPVLVVYASRRFSGPSSIFAFEPLFTDQPASKTKYKGGALYLVANVQMDSKNIGLDRMTGQPGVKGRSFFVMMATGKSKTEKNKEASMTVTSHYGGNWQQWVAKTNDDEVAIRAARRAQMPVHSVLSAPPHGVCCAGRHALSDAVRRPAEEDEGRDGQRGRQGGGQRYPADDRTHDLGAHAHRRSRSAFDLAQLWSARRWTPWGSASSPSWPPKPSARTAPSTPTSSRTLAWRRST